MNKKFLSAVLFGALMVTSTGTFVSCKDYDDDINRIDQELTEIKTAIAALQAKVDEGKYVTNVVKNGEGITITWNDNSTSTIETIKGDKGDKTVITISEDGYWVFDGEKSEYPAKGEKGDQGEPGEAAAAGHDAKISDDGYWMVWDATKGDYVETEYIAGGAMAVEGEHGWTIIVRDESGQEQSIYIPNSADLVSIQDAKDAQAPDGGYDIFYGLVKTDVEWDGAKAVNGKMVAGMYPVLDRDVMIMLNPTGVDGTAYTFDFRDSDNETPWGLTLDEIQPYAGDKLTRAASSASGIWVLPRHIQRVDLNELDERADYITQFKSNDGDEYAFALNATSKEDNSKVVKSQYIYSFDPTNVGDMKAEDFKYNKSLDKDFYVWNVEHTPNFDAIAYTLGLNNQRVNLGQVIYDYKLEIDKTHMTQVQIEKYGLEITEDGYRFIAKKEAAVDNKVWITINYILVNGSKHSMTFDVSIVAKDIVVTDNNIGTLDKAFNATQLGTVAAKTNATQITDLNNKFVYTDKLTFDPKEKLGANYDEWIDAMYKELSSRSGDLAKAQFLQSQASIVGGDPINNDAEYNNALINNLIYFDYVDASGKSCIYDVKNEDRLARLGEIAALEVHFVAGTYGPATSNNVQQVAVKAPYYTIDGSQDWDAPANAFAIPLNNAFSVQLLTEKEDQPVAALNFKFQLTQPEIDKVGIMPKDGLFNLWKDEIDETSGEKTADVLYSFGAYDASKMGLPLYEAFNMWTTNDANLYKWQNDNAQWYYLSNNNVVSDGIELLGAATPTSQPQTNNPYQIDWTDYNTTATAAGGLMTRALGATPSQKDATINVDVKYNFFGVYPALDEQLPFYSTGTVGTPTYQEHPGFRLVFASTIKKSTLETKEDVYTAKAGTHYVFISNDDIIAKTMLGKEYVLLDGLNASGVPTNREELNDARGFNEDIRPFTIAYTSAKSVNGNATLTIGAGALQTGTTVQEDCSSVASSGIDVNWNVNIPSGTIEPALQAVSSLTNDVTVYEVSSRQKFPVGNSAYPNGLPAVEGGYVIQLGQDIDYRQPVEVTFTVTDELGFTNTL